MIEAAVLAWMRATFDIDAEKGLLVWKVPPKHHPRLIGKPAGSARPNHNGKHYVVIKKGQRALKRSRLIFLWTHGRWPEPCVDHIDGNSTNDAIGNLRQA